MKFSNMSKATLSGFQSLAPQLSLYDGVRLTNKTFLKPELNKDDPEFWDKLSNQMKLIIEEVEETRDDGINVKNMKEVRDGVCDILVTALGLAHLAGLDVQKDMTAVLISNLSKVCPTEEDAIATVGYYRATGLSVEYVECPTMEGYVVIVSEDCVNHAGKMHPKGKFLKSVANYRDPVFE